MSMFSVNTPPGRIMKNGPISQPGSLERKAMGGRPKKKPKAPKGKPLAAMAYKP